MTNERDDIATDVRWLREQLAQLRGDVKSLEAKLWGMVAAVFLLIVGYLVSQIQTLGVQPTAPTAAPGMAIQSLLAMIGF